MWLLKLLFVVLCIFFLFCDDRSSYLLRVWFWPSVPSPPITSASSEVGFSTGVGVSTEVGVYTEVLAWEGVWVTPVGTGVRRIWGRLTAVKVAWMSRESWLLSQADAPQSAPLAPGSVPQSHVPTTAAAGASTSAALTNVWANTCARRRCPLASPTSKLRWNYFEILNYENN